MVKRLWLLFLAALASMPAMAQSASDEGNIFRESGKIYVVIAVIAIVFLALIIYLVNTDRKVAKLEKELRNKQ
jgi:CcmD family protein